MGERGAEGERELLEGLWIAEDGEEIERDAAVEGERLEGGLTDIGAERGAAVFEGERSGGGGGFEMGGGGDVGDVRRVEGEGGDGIGERAGGFEGGGETTGDGGRELGGGGGLGEVEIGEGEIDGERAVGGDWAGRAGRDGEVERDGEITGERGERAVGGGEGGDVEGGAGEGGGGGELERAEGSGEDGEGSGLAFVNGFEVERTVVAEGVHGEVAEREAAAAGGFGRGDGAAALPLDGGAAVLDRRGLEGGEPRVEVGEFGEIAVEHCIEGERSDERGVTCQRETIAVIEDDAAEGEIGGIVGDGDVGFDGLERGGFPADGGGIEKGLSGGRGEIAAGEIVEIGGKRAAGDETAAFRAGEVGDSRERAETFEVRERGVPVGGDGAIAGEGHGAVEGDGVAGVELGAAGFDRESGAVGGGEEIEGLDGDAGGGELAAG